MTFFVKWLSTKFLADYQLHLLSLGLNWLLCITQLTFILQSVSESIESSSNEPTQSQEQPTCTSMCSTSRSSRGIPISKVMLYTGEGRPPDHLDIETPPTSPDAPPTSPECGHSHINREKTTDWIRHVSNRFDQSCVSEPMKMPVDSGKRRRDNNFMAGGLAERMQRIIQRENAEITFWEHRSAREQETGIVYWCASLSVLC